MADLVHVSKKKAEEHIRLISHIAELMQEEAEEVKLSFLRWSIPFIYTDYIYLPLEEKIAFAETLLDVWIGCGYFDYCKKLESWIREQFSYVSEMRGEQAEEVNVSVIFSVEGRAEHIAECLEGICSQSFRKMELIIVNSGVSNQVYSILHKNLFRDKRIRLYNMPSKADTQILQIGEQLAIGEYLLFADCNGWYSSEQSIERWYQYSKKRNVDLCASASLWQESKLVYFDHKIDYSMNNKINDNKENNDRNNNDRNNNNRNNNNKDNNNKEENNKKMEEYPVSETEYYHVDFRTVLYRREFLEEKKISFRECGAFSGELFLLECLMAAEKKEYNPVYHYIQCRRSEKIEDSERQGEKLLRGMLEVMQKTVERENPYAHAKILDMLCSNYLKNCLLSCMHLKKGEGEWQLKIILELYQLFRLVNLELLKKGGYRINKIFYTNVLYEVLKERQQELADLSLEVLKNG